MHNTDDLTWATSSYSGGNGACVEVAKTTGGAFFRDTKDRGIPAAAASGDAWGAFLQGVRAGTLGA
jgi:predicted secreted Zn-dependent protease